MSRRSAIAAALAALSAAALPAGAAAQSALVAQAIASGQAGERYDGYLGAVPGAPAEVRRQVAAVNIVRRSLYVELATRRGVTIDLVGSATACERLAQVAVGQPYLAEDQQWRRRLPGQPPPVPAFCR